MLDLLGFFSKPVPQTNNSENSLQIIDQICLKPFSHTSNEQLTLIADKTAAFKKTVENMHVINRPMVLAMIGMGISVVGSAILPYAVTTFWLSFAVSYKNFDKYREINTQFNKERAELLKLYEWVMDDKSFSSIRQKLVVGIIQDLIITLGTWVPKEKIHRWKDNDLKQEGVWCYSTEDRTELKELIPALRKLEQGVYQNYSEWYACELESVTNYIQSAVSGATRMIGAAG